MKKKGKRFVNKSVARHLIVTAITGVVFWLIGEIAFSALTEKLWTPLGIAIYFLIFAVMIMIVFFVILVTKTDFSKKENKRNIKDGYVVGAIIMAGVVLFSCLFEFLYELGGQDVYEPSSYVFLVDDSGSMGGTEDIRVNAIKEVMENSDADKPYAVYKFADMAVQIKPMGTYRSDDVDKFVFESNGGTEILGSISTVLDDLNNGNLGNAGSSPKILLVSDGGSSSFGLRRVAKKCRNSGVSVSTIGVEGSSEGFLQKIADNTGGVFIRCSDVSQLSDSFEQAKAMNTERNLLSERFVYKHDGLYAFLRIAFLVILGVAWSFAKSFISYEHSDKSKTCIISSVVCCTVGVLIVEFLSGTFISIKLLRLVFCVLWALTYGKMNSDKKSSEAIYGASESVQIGNPGADGSMTDSLHSENENDAFVKGFSFTGQNGGDNNQAANPVASPFSGNPMAPGGNNVTGANGGFTQNPFGGNSPSVPFGSGSSNPFGGSSPTNPFDGNTSNPFS